MDTPFRVPEPLLHWLDVARAPAGSTVTQGAATRFQQGGWPDYRQHPDTRDMVLTAPSRWEVLRGEAAETDATGTARILHSLRLAGWFDRAGGVLVGRTGAPAHGDFGQLDAVRDALGDLPVPVLHDVDLGHVPPQLALVDGADAVVELDGEGRGTLVQRLG